MSSQAKSDEKTQHRIRESFAKQSAMKLIGAKLSLIEAGAVEITMPFHLDLAQQHGFLHAGILSTALDSACGYAAMTLMPEDMEVLTIEFKVNLLSPGKGDLFLFRGEVTKSGRTISVCDGKAYSIIGENKKLIASMTGTMIVAPR